VATAGELFPGRAPNVAGPYGLGQRVPMLVVSPWSTGGWVCSEVFDHTSIVRFIERRFGVREPNISPWRRTVCGDLTSAFNFTGARPKVPALPDTVGYRPRDRQRHPDYVPVPPSRPALPAQERGVRPARPLPYDLAADGRAGAGTLRIDFANHCRAGAHFLVTSTTNADGPWTYTVGPGRALTASWAVPSPTFEFSVHGPNGFHRQFAGRTRHEPVGLRALHDGDRGLLRLVLTNHGTEAVELTMSDTYRGGHPLVRRLRPGACLVHCVDVRESHGWYDMSVEAEQFVRRLRGHVETGRPSTSDPAIGAGWRRTND
jgi:phospholipase C